jgi:hypothetical protein
MTESEAFGGSFIVRAWEPPEEVVLHRSTVETPGLQPEDLGVLSAVLLRDPELPATAKAIASDLREQRGWKMSVDRFEAVFKRLERAGHAHRESVFNPRTKRPEWVLRVYRNPANNAAYVARGAEAASQVKDGVGENPTSSRASGSELGENPVSQGQGRNRVFPDSGAESGFPRVRDHGVSAGQGRNRVFPDSADTPPHPPGGGGTSSPYPLKAEAARGGRGREEGEDAAQQEETHAQLLAAADFLQELPKPWRVGRQTAREYAPLLLEALAEQGWELGPELVRELTQNPGGVRSYPRTLKSRILDLPRAWRQTRPDAVTGADSERCPHHPARELATCPCQLAEAAARYTDDEPRQHPAADDAEDAAAVRAAAQRALAALRSKAVGSGTGSSKRPPRSRAAREAAARQAEDARRAAAAELLADDGSADASGAGEVR